MKLSLVSLVAACASAVAARSIAAGSVDEPEPRQDMFLIETKPGMTRWVTDAEKWELIRAGLHFMDITDTRYHGARTAVPAANVSFPDECVRQKDVYPLVDHLDKTQMRARLERLSSFHTRFFRTESGLQASDWIQANVSEVVKRAEAESSVSVTAFGHPWMQHSVIASIQGRTNNTIVIGAHLDSVNMFLPFIMPAPGADDDGSGTVTTMEVLRALLKSDRVAKGEAINTIEFHWYSAEEGGLLGSQAIFQSYQKAGRKVKAMLQQDMTGYVKGTLDAGKPESVGVITDFVHPGLIEFIKKVIEEYCTIPWVETKCGYACSDHASASKAGYPSAFVIESEFSHSNPHIHTAHDVIEHLDFDHMLQHARMTLGLVYELAFHNFDDEKDDRNAGEL